MEAVTAPGQLPRKPPDQNASDRMDPNVRTYERLARVNIRDLVRRGELPDDEADKEVNRAPDRIAVEKCQDQQLLESGLQKPDNPQHQRSDPGTGHNPEDERACEALKRDGDIRRKRRVRTHCRFDNQDDQKRLENRGGLPLRVVADQRDECRSRPRRRSFP